MRQRSLELPENKKIQIVLGIETSCDETGVAIYHAKQGLLADKLHSQIDIHAKYGGIIPEIASRDHIQKILPLIQEVLAEAGLTFKDLDGIAYTAGPGLIGALFVGASVGRTIGWALHIPTVAIHHMEGHLLSPMLEEQKPTFPFLALLVSGGHTLLVNVRALGEYDVLGETIDDAIGEAFDKTAKLLGLSYPGGPALAALAKQGVVGRFKFTRPMVNRPGLDFSFSGLKTQVLQCVKKNQPLDQQTKADIAYAFQETVVDTLLIKCRRAIEQSQCRCLVISGGVSANQLLRKKLTQYAEKNDVDVFFPRHEFCTDNGAMIAYAGYLRLSAGQTDPLAIMPRARWPLNELSQPERMHDKTN